MKVSVVIPTLNAGLDFVDVLTAIRHQEIEAEVEIVVVDSSSTDGTRERAEHHGAVVFPIPRENFNHGRTRNLGIKVATGELIALLTQDAEPRDPQWLKGLIEPFEDPRVAGVYSRVVPRNDASPLVERSVKADLVYSEERLYKKVDNLEEWHAKHPFERRVEGHFNNVSSCVRRSVVEEIPFPEIFFGEDLAWGIKILEAGHALVYEPSSAVVHSHPTSLIDDFKRHKADARLQWVLLGFRNRPSPLSVIRAVGGEVRKDWVFLKSKSVLRMVGYGIFSPFLRTVQVLGQFVGSYGREPK